MRLTARLWVAAVIVVLCSMLLSSSSAWAADKIYMSVESSHGAFKGEGTNPGSPWIVIQAMNESIGSPRDPATGQAMGRRQHEAIKIVKQMGASSAQFTEAAQRGEALKKVVFEFVHVNPAGKERVYRTIQLSDAMVAAVQAQRAGGHPTEEITLSYQKIEERNAPEQGNTATGRIEPKAVWENPR